MSERLAPERHDSLPDVAEPSENPRLYGHGEIADALASAHCAGKLHHALLLAGPPGIGKATLAFHLANHLLRHPDPATAPERLAAPDPASPVFRQIASDAHPSVLHLTRPLNERTKAFKTAVTAEEIKRISRFLSRTAHDGGWRVVIVDPADDMNRHAANALLKNLEEPPARTVFILIAHRPGRLLSTIRSRCRLVRLQPLSADALAAAVRAARPDIGALPEHIAAKAEGSVRNALLGLLYGGGEIAETIQHLLTARELDLARLYTLAEAVGGRGPAIQFDIFNREMLERIAEAAREAAASGRLAAAERLAGLWQATAEATAEAEAYNLDRKQHVVGTVIRAHGIVRGKTVPA